MGQLKEMSRAGIEIAAHTRSHPNLGAASVNATLYDEIIDATRELASHLGQPVRYFAFPFGMPDNLNRPAAAMLREEGIKCVVSAYGGYNKVGDSTFHLQRCHGDPELNRLKNSLTFDLRHLLKHKIDLESTCGQTDAAVAFYHQQVARSSNVFPVIQAATPSSTIPTMSS